MSLLNQNKQHLLYLDTIRALAALYVVLHHAMLQYYFIKPQKLSTAEKVIVKVFSDGHLAVDMFIVLSGFSLMIAITRNNYQFKGGVLLFLKRRVIRIVPAYYAAMFVSLILAATCIGINTGSSWDMSINANRIDIISHLLFFHDVFVSTSTKINYSLWSIAVEWRLYLFFPFLIWLWRKRGLGGALMSALLTTLVLSIALANLKSVCPGINLLRSGVSPLIIPFSLGMAAADISFSKKARAVQIRSLYSSVNNSIVVAFFIVSFIIYKLIPVVLASNSASALNLEFITEETKDIVFGFIAAAFLFASASAHKLTDRQNIIAKLLNWRPLVFVGTFSYSLYLIHPPLLQIFSQYILAPYHLSALANTCLIVVLGTPFVIFLSYLFFLMFERPFLRNKRSYSVKNTEQLTVHEALID